MFILLLVFLPFASSDVLRTVFCKNQCNDYLRVPESQMPACTDDQTRQLNECGTVITCDWSEAERDKIRPLANSTDLVCCYRTIIKTKGACDTQVPQVKVTHEAAVQTNKVHQQTSSACNSNTLPWIIASVLLMVVALQAGYIIFTCSARQSMQKVTSFDAPCQRPIYTARPLINERLLA